MFAPRFSPHEIYDRFNNSEKLALAVQRVCEIRGKSIHDYDPNNEDTKYLAMDLILDYLSKTGEVYAEKFSRILKKLNTNHKRIIEIRYFNSESPDSDVDYLGAFDELRKSEDFLYLLCEAIIPNHSQLEELMSR